MVVKIWGEKITRKILALVLSVALVAGIVSISPVSGSTATLFTDISNHWAKDGILHAAETV